MKKFLISLVLALFFITPASLAFTGEVPESVQTLEKRGVFVEEKNTPYNSAHFVTREEFLRWTMENAKFSKKYYKAKAEPFTDIKKRNPFHPYIAGAWASGALDFLKGKTKFLPKKKISRLESLQILFGIEGISSFQKYTKKSHLRWKDLPKNPQKKNILVTGYSKGFIKKTSNRTLSPRKKLRMEEAVRMLFVIQNQQKITSEQSKKTNIEITQSLIENQYWKKNEVEKEKLEEAAITSMLKSLDDPYSVYLPPKTAKIFSDSILKENKKSLNYAGIGVSVQTANEGGIVITGIFDGSPAKKFGLQVGDRIVGVDGENFSNTTITSEVTDHIKGIVGTSVKLTLIRDGEKIEKTVTRGKINLEGYSSIFATTKENIVWIHVRSFGGQTAKKFQKILQENITKNTQGIIIDLRYNGGGLMRSAQQMLGEILPKESLTLRLEKNGKESLLKVQGSGEFTTIPLVVFQNEYSASASEIFSASIKDYQRGKIIGTKSFGKGIAQNLFTLSNGATIKLTTSEFLSPLGNTIHHKGVEPDVKIEKKSDNIFFALAKRYLKK